MGIWSNGGFFSRMRGNLIKWWRLTILPVFHLNNNNPAEVKEQIKKGRNNMDDNLVENRTETAETSGMQPGVNQPSTMQETASQMKLGESEMDIIARLDRERKAEAERKQREIDSARQAVQEKERIDAIMNANKVDLNSFIEEGMANREKSVQSKEDVAEAARKEEEMRCAQEIIDRLNREAAEDEAKKQAEIAEAKKQAQETFGQ